MSRSSPFRFAVVAAGPHDRASWGRLCAEAEARGYDALYLPDTLTMQLGPLAALGAAAAQTTTLRLGMLVANNDLRNPVVLAKELATLDVLSEGRLDWGMGAGWYPPDYRAAGLRLDPPGVRVDRLVEAVDLIERAFSDAQVDVGGRHYPVDGLVASPEPVQRPRPPLLIGGAERRLLTFAGARADVVSLNRSFATASFGGRPPEKRPDEAVVDQLAWIRAGAGRRIDQVELSMEVNPPVVITDHRAAAVDELAAASGLPRERLLADPRTWVGTTQTIADDVRRHRERFGISHWVVYEPYLRDVAPIVAELAGT